MRITLEDLARTYETQSGGHISAVNGVSLEIPSNTVYGIIGKSGAGKSTLVRLISLLEKPDSGSVSYDGRRVDSLGKKKLIAQRRRIGMIFQNFNLFASRTAAGNVAYPLEIAGAPKSTAAERTEELLDLVGLGNRGNAPISTLSGGQKQRIAIARALANNPDILFCDEATSALDPQTTRSILDLIRDIQHKMNLTVVMITHQMEVVRDACEKVAVLDEGRVVEQGNVSDIFSRPQSPVTKEFLSHMAPFDSGEENTMVRWSQEGGRYTLRFKGSLTGEPVLSRAGRMFDIEFNIRAGGIQHLPHEDVGTLLTDITGSPEETAKAVAYLRSEGIIVEEDTGQPSVSGFTGETDE